MDPANTTLRGGIVVSRRQYSVPWPSSLWHLEGHHSLIRWGFVVHGCIDGFSRRVVFLRCSNNHLSQTVLQLLLKAIEKDGLWPSRIRMDYGVENILLYDAMVEARGEGRGSFIAVPLRQIRELKDSGGTSSGVCVIFFYFVFYAMENTGLLNVDNATDIFALHLTFLPRINLALDEYMDAFNHHKVRTATHWSPYQIWVNGMLKDDNPLVHGQLEEDPDDLDFYGVDPAGPSPFRGCNKNVVVPPVALPVEHQSVRAKVLERIDPLMSSM